MKRRLSIITTLLMLCAMGAQAQDYVQFPTSGTTMVDLSDKEVGYTLYLYDNGGPQGYYSNYCDGWVLLKAPADCFLYVDGLVDTEDCCDYINIYNGTSSDQLIVSQRGTTTVSVRSDGDMLLYFHTDGSVVRSGLDLTVVVSQEVVKGDFVYADRGRTILLNYIGNDSEVRIPSSVEKIGNNVFAGNPNLTKVVFGSNITKISSYTFQNCANLATVDMSRATSLTSIGGYAFYNCDALTSVTIPENVTSIGSYAFYDCANLATVDMSRATSLTTIGSYAFRNCDALAKITIPENVTSISSYAFYECSNLATVDLSNAKSLTSIGYMAFFNCDALTKITIPENVTSIGEYAFQDCFNLATVDMSRATSLTSIGYQAFYNCDALTKITIPEKVTTIGSYAFQDCNNLATVDMSNVKSLTKINDYVFNNCDALTKITIPENVTTIGNYAFYDCDGLKEITIPEKVTSIGEYAFYSCDNLAKADLSNAKSLTSIGIYAFYGCDALTKIAIPENVTTIGSYAFQSCSNLATVDMSSAKSLTTIGSYAFANNTNLKTADLSNAESLTTINDYAFSSCANLEKVDLSGAKNLSYVNNNAFLRCPKLKSFGSSGGKAIYSADGKTLICYLAVSPDTAFTVPSTVTTIANNAFINCNKLKQVTIPSSVTSIGSYAFNGCNNLAKIDLSKATGLTSFGSYAFSGCPKLATIDLSATSLTTIGSSAFYGNDYLTEITLPESVTSIGESAFYDCDNLKQVTIPSSVTTIGNYAFYGCGKLAKVDFNKARDLTYIGVNTFNACALTTIDLSATSLTTIGSSAFYDNNYLTEITLPESVILIDSYAFYSCNNLATVDMSSAKNLTTIGDYAFQYCGMLKEAAFPESLTSIGYMAFSYCTNLEKADFSKAKNLISIGSYAFEYCNKLASADLSKATSLANIYSGAFRNCNELTDVAVPESITYVAGGVLSGCDKVNFTKADGALYLGNQRNPYVVLYKASSTDITECRINNKTKVIAHMAFTNCTNLKSINIPGSVVSINQDAFNGCVGLEKVSLPDNISSIDYRAFSNCYSLASVDVPSSVESIGDEAFTNVRNINYTGKLGSATSTWGALMRNGKMSWGYTNGDFVFSDEAKTNLIAYVGSGGSIEIPESTITIDANAFLGCKGITKVVIPDNVKTINSQAFKGCTGLKTISIGSGVTSISSDAFNGCPVETLTYNTSAIGSKFQQKTTLKKVVVGDKVTSIGYQAFNNCANLETVDLSRAKNLTTIGDYAFYDCSNLATVDLSRATSLSTIGSYAFYDCDILTKIAIPENLTTIGSYAFRHCANLATVDMSNATSLTSIGNQAFYNCDALTKITIPENVITIGNYAFYDCDGLKEITIPEKVTSIGEYAFQYCDNLAKVDLSNAKSLTSIGGYAFYNCSALTTITIPVSVTSIGYRAFKGCYALKSVTIGSGVTSINDNAFDECNSIETLTFNTNYIGGHFKNKTSLKKVVVGDKVTSIGSYAFYNCANLATVDLSKAKSLTSISSYAFAGSSITKIEIPNSVTSIGSNAFYECYGLTEITIPESVTTIGSKAFYGCDGLLKVDLSNAKSLTRIENEAFYSCDNLAELDLENAESLNFIGNWAIAYCPSLESIIIPKSVKNMGSYVFRYSSNISPILCEADSKPWGWSDSWNWNNYQVIWHYNNIKVNVETSNSTLGTVVGSGTYTYGDEIHIKATPAKGAVFSGWDDDTPFDEFTVPAMEDIDITAIFAKRVQVGKNTVYAKDGDYYNCVFTPEKSANYRIYSNSDSDTFGYLLDGEKEYLTEDDDSGENLNFEITYYLEGGKTYYLGVMFLDFDEEEGNINFTVEEVKPYIVSATAKNGTVEGTGAYYYGVVASLHAIPDEGYHFVKWSDGETSSWYHIDVYNDVNLTAEFAINEYEITGSVSSGYGTIGGTGTYAHGSEVSLIAKPNKGYEFIRWGDGNTDNPRRFKAEQTKEYYAVVVSKTFNVEASGNHVSSVDIWGDCYYGNTIELKAWPEYNYHFKEWRDSRGNVISTSNPFYYTVTEDAKFTAVVEGDEFTIGTSMDNGTVQGGGTYNYGSKVTLTAVANPGFKFAGWADAVQTATRTITVNYNVDYTAYTLPIKYSVELSAENGVVSGGATNLSYGDEVTISATPNSGFKFVRWSDGNTSATRTLTITRDYTLKAVCMDAAETLYTISATAGQNGSVMGGGRYKAGEKVTLTAIANPGYHFVKWSDGSTNANNVVTVSGDKSLSAEFAVNTYTVSVTAGANGTATGGGSFEFGAPATITATPATGYHFAGWSDGSAVANRTFNVSADLDLKAEFAINTYSVKATAKNGRVEGTGTYNHGAEATLTATAATGYHFSQWSDGNTTNPRKATVTADMEFAAEFEVNTYEITAAAQNGTVSGAGTYNYGAMAALTATANAGYHFTQWNDGVLSSSRSVFVSEDMKFTAEFAIDAYNVSAYAQNGSVEGAGYYNHGASATLTAKANEGYHFTQWSDGVKDKSRTETVLSSMSFEAEFEVNSFNITAAESANGVVSGAGTYSYGAMATLTAVANEGYHFTQWSDGLTSATRRLTVVEDAEFGATFEINSYEVKLSAENGTVSGAGTFEHGAEATISAKAAEHYHFARWSDGNTDNPRKLTVTKNRSLKAVFEADLFTIKVEAENGTIYGASSGFEFGAVATLTASPDLGYHFEKWSDGNTDNPRSVTIDATVLSNLDKPFTAIFEKNPSYVGIEESAAREVSIYAYGNTIVVENAAADIFVYDAMGRMIVRETAAADRTEIQVEGTGVYVVKTGSASKRVMIK